MKIFCVLLGLLVIWFVGGMLAAAIVGSKKNRRRFALHIFLSLSDDAKSMLFDVFKLYQMRKVGEVNSIIVRATNTTREIISVLSPGNRPQEFSSGKIFDRTTWTVYQAKFIKNGYCEPGASLLAGVFFFELEELLGEKK